MISRYFVLWGIIMGLMLLFTATLYYPGGSQADVHSVGYSFTNNYLSNLFNTRAVNGAANTAKPWATAGMLFMTLSFGLFFIRFADRLKVKSATTVIKICGIIAMLGGFLTTVTPLHDAMIPIAATLSLVACFYITVFVFKTKLHWHKLLSVIMLLLVYTCCYLYSTRTLAILPIMQKVAFLTNIIWVLSLEYFSTKDDFAHITK